MSWSRSESPSCSRSAYSRFSQHPHILFPVHRVDLDLHAAAADFFFDAEELFDGSGEVGGPVGEGGIGEDVFGSFYDFLFHLQSKHTRMMLLWRTTSMNRLLWM